MSEEELDENGFPPYDGLGDEDDDSIPAQEGDDDQLEDFEDLVKQLDGRFTEISAVDDLIGVALEWVDDEATLEDVEDQFEKAEAALYAQAPEGEDLSPFLSAQLRRLEAALDNDDEDEVLLSLLTISGELQPAAPP